MSSEIRLEGWDAFKGKLNRVEATLLPKIGAIVFDEALRWAQLAKRSAPVNYGRLRSEIQGVQINQLTSEVVSPIKYSPYREWGTGNYVVVPADLVDYAIQFKGLKKVIGSKPTAFFFIHKSTVQKSLLTRVQNALSKPQ